MSSEEQTTRVITTAFLMAPGAQIVKPRAGHRLRVIEEPIPPETLPIDKSKGAARKPGP